MKYLISIILILCACQTSKPQLTPKEKKITLIHATPEIQPIFVQLAQELTQTIDQAPDDIKTQSQLPQNEEDLARLLQNQELYQELQNHVNEEEKEEERKASPFKKSELFGMLTIAFASGTLHNWQSTNRIKKFMSSITDQIENAKKLPPGSSIQHSDISSNKLVSYKKIIDGKKELIQLSTIKNKSLEIQSNKTYSVDKLTRENVEKQIADDYKLKIRSAVTITAAVTTAALAAAYVYTSYTDSLELTKDDQYLQFIRKMKSINQKWKQAHKSEHNFR